MANIKDVRFCVVCGEVDNRKKEISSRNCLKCKSVNSMYYVDSFPVWVSFKEGIDSQAMYIKKNNEDGL